VGYSNNNNGDDSQKITARNRQLQVRALRSRSLT
jgi:hypothetical protein